jgi:hypothetical protein
MPTDASVLQPNLENASSLREMPFYVLALLGCASNDFWKKRQQDLQSCFLHRFLFPIVMSIVDLLFDPAPCPFSVGKKRLSRAA